MNQETVFNNLKSWASTFDDQKFVSAIKPLLIPTCPPPKMTAHEKVSNWLEKLPDPSVWGKPSQNPPLQPQPLTTVANQEPVRQPGLPTIETLIAKDRVSPSGDIECTLEAFQNASETFV